MKFLSNWSTLIRYVHSYPVYDQHILSMVGFHNCCMLPWNLCFDPAFGQDRQGIGCSFSSLDLIWSLSQNVVFWYGAINQFPCWLKQISNLTPLIPFLPLDIREPPFKKVVVTPVWIIIQVILIVYLSTIFSLSWKKIAAGQELLVLAPSLKLNQLLSRPITTLYVLKINQYLKMDIVWHFSFSLLIAKKFKAVCAKRDWIVGPFARQSDHCVLAFAPFKLYLQLLCQRSDVWNQSNWFYFWSWRTGWVRATRNAERCTSIRSEFCMFRNFLKILY